jgi:hypothetical protein
VKIVLIHIEDILLNNLMLGTTDPKSIGVSLASNNSSLVNSTSSHGITSN